MLIKEAADVKTKFWSALSLVKSIWKISSLVGYWKELNAKIIINNAHLYLVYVYYFTNGCFPIHREPIIHIKPTYIFRYIDMNYVSF